MAKLTTILGCSPKFMRSQLAKMPKADLRAFVTLFAKEWQCEIPKFKEAVAWCLESSNEDLDYMYRLAEKHHIYKFDRPQVSNGDALDLSDRDNCQMLIGEIRDVLNAVAAKHGLFILSNVHSSHNRENNTLNFHGTFSMKPRLTESKADSWNQYCHQFGLLPEWLHRIVNINNVDYKIVGLNPFAKLHKVIIADHTGKTFCRDPMDISARIQIADKLKLKQVANG